MAISHRIAGYLTRSSWIRAMFERGIELRAEFGEDGVYDFSLGNPHLEPPEEFRRIMYELVSDPRPGMHRYMPNAGLPEAREAVSARLARETGLPFTRKQIVMSVGAGGGMNIFLKTITEEHDRILVLSPYFPEYDFYIESHGGVPVSVATDSEFQIDVSAVEAALDPFVAAVIVNSPNNPTGVVYSEDRLRELCDLLSGKERQWGKEIYLVSDEPYRRIAYDEVQVPWIFSFYRNSVVVTSHSKDLNLAGERIGFVALNPDAVAGDDLFRGMVFNQRALGMVSAPALFQRAVARLQDVTVDVTDYERKRDRLYAELTRMGYSVVKPGGAFYMFPKAPGGDGVRFVSRLQEERILCVPGVGFGTPGYFRISFACPDDQIERALPGFERAIGAFDGHDA